MKKLMFLVPTFLHEALTARSKESGAPVSEIVRRILLAALLSDQPRIEKRTQQPLLIPLQKAED